MTAPASPPAEVVVLLDVNGTLVPHDTPGPPLPRIAARLARAVALAHEAGVSVGLCSDSPLEQLRAFGHHIGLGPPGRFPVVAENGAIVAWDGRLRPKRPFPHRAAVRAVVSRRALAAGLRQSQDVVGPEFGGGRPPGDAWAFGANRRSSVSVFAPPDLVTVWARYLTCWGRRAGVRLAVDAAPRHSYLGIHSCVPLRSGKRRVLAELARAGHRVVMVGDSPADWVPPGTGVRCAFVADANVPAAVRAACWHAATRPGAAGVVEVLRRVAAERPPGNGHDKGSGHDKESGTEGR
ncbi:HAD family hydrolase [Streptomyces aureocirculatus]|uniref:hypothetical protein n=1 Tax=Streptomyces aureocirculatus TaxID=67275 RepID=UPI0004C80E49|nr:hypothetical protein [Streptomyces aureocirculatus]